jgi:hypothetical protein
MSWGINLTILGGDGSAPYPAAKPVKKSPFGLGFGPLNLLLSL